MCIALGSRLFVRTDNAWGISEKLPDVKTTNVSPAGHMNYDGGMGYNNSGYLSLFEYKPNQIVVRGDNEFRQAVASFVCGYLQTYVHFLFIPANVQQIELTEETVNNLPTSGRTPSLLNTDNCRPPSKRGEDGSVLTYANREINEYLYLGSWANGIKVITEKVNSSRILDLMRMRQPLDVISKCCDKEWPCSNRMGYDPDKDPRGPNGPSGNFGGSICT